MADGGRPRQSVMDHCPHRGPRRLFPTVPRLLLGLLALALTVGLAPTIRAQPGTAPVTEEDVRLGQRLKPIVDCLTGRAEQFTLRAEWMTDTGETRSALLRRSGPRLQLLIRAGDQIDIRLERNEELTRLVLAHHEKTFVGEGTAPTSDHLAPAGLARRLISPDSALERGYQALKMADPNALEGVVYLYSGLVPVTEDLLSTRRLGELQVHLDPVAPVVTLNRQDHNVRLTRLPDKNEMAVVTEPVGEVVQVDRAELERMIVRGLRRMGEVAHPGPPLRRPTQRPLETDHGRLTWQKGHRVLLLKGMPEQIGRATGRLLAEETRRTVDSALHLVGLTETLKTGRWFPGQMSDAWERLQPHIPADHLAEMNALADAAEIPRRQIHYTNVFPELFHCSGFAVFGRATVDGTLYHGRVLDYMTRIGLQDSATIMMVAVDDKIPFVNVGYAGFIGSVSAMNVRGISLGEMGGAGEGRFDGVPMATLMRQAAETCTSLDEVKALWAHARRTCEYFYIFAQGEPAEAVGVHATDKVLTQIDPGQDHPNFITDIPDAVLMSADERLKHLQRRVRAHHGRIDAERALSLMARPVAMPSNLHNVLFVPARHRLYVSHASHDAIAAEREPLELDVRELAAELARLPAPPP
ncbi:MAG: C45 family peptidase [Phycisphaeraceae bacterium]|nr:C45 family peptidase [Phycisphaeraceae bacterium]